LYQAILLCEHPIYQINIYSTTKAELVLMHDVLNLDVLAENFFS